jgi:hypothetical protein
MYAQPPGSRSSINSAQPFVESSDLMLLQLDLVAKVRQTCLVLRDLQAVFLDVRVQLDPPKLVG